MRVNTLGIIFALTLTISGCVSGSAEFQVYGEAFDAQTERGNALLDRLSAAERSNRQKILERSDGSTAFDPELAAYYVDVGDPPITASLRSSLKSVALYNDLLISLANGEYAKARAAKVGAIIANLRVARNALSVVAPRSLAVSTAISATATRLLPLFQQLSALHDRQTFRREVIRAYPDIRELLLALRAGTPDMFQVIRDSYVQVGRLDLRGGISAADLEKLDAVRQQLAGWVILIDATIVALDNAVRVVLSTSSTTDLQALLDTSIELKVLVETLRSSVNQ